MTLVPTNNVSFLVVDCKDCKDCKGVNELHSSSIESTEELTPWLQPSPDILRLKLKLGILLVRKWYCTLENPWDL